MSVRSAWVVLVGGSLLVGGVLASTTGAVTRWNGGSIVIVGGNRGQRELARITGKRVGGETLARVVFGSPVGVLRREHLHGTEMIVSSQGKPTLRSMWEQQLFVGTYLGLMQRWRGAGIAAAATGQSEARVGRLRPYDVFGSNPKAIKVASFARNLVNASILVGARIVELRTIATPARLVAFTVQVGDAAAFLKHRVKRLLNLLWHPSIKLLGYYFAVEDSTGALVFATSRLPNTGGLFVTRSLDNCSPVGHGDAITLTQPPPCPAG
jgi:hypothetical protein